MRNLSKKASAWRKNERKKRWKRFISILLIFTLILPDIMSGFNLIYAKTETDSTAIGFSEYQDAMNPNEDTNSYSDRIDAFFIDNKDMPVISYNFNLGNDFELSDVLLNDVIEITEENGKVIGEAKFSENNGSLIVNVTFKNSIYNRLEAKLGFSQDIQVKETSLKEEPVFVGWSNDGFVVNTRAELEGETPEVKEPYTITKEEPAKVNGTEIEYTIEVTGEKLNGCTVEDILPKVNEVLKLAQGEQAFLNVIQVKVDGNEKSNSVTSDGKCRYTFRTDGDTITDAIITIRVALTDGQKKN